MLGEESEKEKAELGGKEEGRKKSSERFSEDRPLRVTPYAKPVKGKVKNKLLERHKKTKLGCNAVNL